MTIIKGRVSGPQWRHNRGGGPGGGGEVPGGEHRDQAGQEDSQQGQGRADTEGKQVLCDAGTLQGTYR